MELYNLLDKYKKTIIDTAVNNLECVKNSRYHEEGTERLRQRLETLYFVVMDCIKNRQLLHIYQYSERIANERFKAGYDLQDVQTAFNILEELIWKKIIEKLAADQLAEALGLVSTVLSRGKESLARTYVNLASSQKVTSLNLDALFEGI